MKKLCFIVFSLCLMTACSSGLAPRDVGEYYVSTGVSKYFLSDIPSWANFSQGAKCFRSKRLRYFDISALMKSYSLKYADTLQLQATFNVDFLAATKQSETAFSLKEEEVLFFQSNEKINHKITFFDPPTFKQVHLIWADEMLRGEKEKERLKQFLTSAVHDNGVPVLVSACMTKEEVESALPGLALKVMSAELFSIYDQAGGKLPSLHIEINAFFKPDQKIIFYSQETKKAPEDIQGAFTLSTY